MLNSSYVLLTRELSTNYVASVYEIPKINDMYLERRNYQYILLYKQTKSFLQLLNYSTDFIIQFKRIKLRRTLHEGQLPINQAAPRRLTCHSFKCLSFVS